MEGVKQDYSSNNDLLKESVTRETFRIHVYKRLVNILALSDENVLMSRRLLESLLEVDKDIKEAVPDINITEDMALIVIIDKFLDKIESSVRSNRGLLNNMIDAFV